LWEKVQAVHGVDVAVAAPHASERSPFYASSAEEATRAAARLYEAGVLTSRQADVLLDALRRFWSALREAPPALNHGDLSTENALWHRGRVVALLDFEFAVIAPSELDLNELLKCAYAPPEEEDPLPDPGGAGLRRVREVAADLAVHELTHPGASDVLLGYAILLEFWSMENWLSKWDGKERFDNWQPYLALTSLANGAAGYLAPVLARVATGL
jgi:scyllo-inosamine 4-kinase